MSGETGLLLAEVRALHAPEEPHPNWYPLCQGCDVGGGDADQPDWPCRTARIVYSADEISLHAWLRAEKRHEWLLAHPPDPNAKRFDPWAEIRSNLAKSIDASIFTIPIRRAGS